MASATLETNKLLAAILTAGILASGSGVISRIIYHPEQLPEPVYMVEMPEGEGAAGEEGAAVAQPIAVLLAAADPARGETAARQCAACHTFEQGGAVKIGPPLWGVIGRDIAAVEGFAYSDALASLEGVWDYENLNHFLADPRGFAPGTKMAYAGLRRDDARADLIMYLRSISPDAPPLPEPEAAAAAEEEPAEPAAAAEGGEAQEAKAAAQPTTEGTADEPAVAGGEPAAQGEQDAAAATTAQAEPAAQAADGGQPEAQQQQTAAAQPQGGGEGEAQPAAAAGAVAMIAAGDPGEGEKAARKCAACHTFAEGGPKKIGPPLWDVVGRDIAGVEGFAYSDALVQKEGAWDWQALDHFITNPREFAPGTKMAFAGVRKEEERADLLAYLRSLSDDPQPLPGG